VNKSSVVYQSSRAHVFAEQLADIERKDKIRGSRLHKAMREILASPYGKVEFGKGQYRGKRKYTVGKDRLLFVVCKQCRDLKHQIFNQCSDCDKTKDETVVWAGIIDTHKY